MRFATPVARSEQTPNTSRTGFGKLIKLNLPPELLLNNDPPGDPLRLIEGPKVGRSFLGFRGG